MRVKREELLQQLESVSPGLAARELIEQSSCFVFKDGRVFTFNDEVACSIECLVADTVAGAVVAKPLIELLSKLPDDEIDVSMGKERVLVKGKRRRAEVVMEAEMALPIDSVESPGEWVELEREFLDAVNITQAVAGKGKDTNFNLTCVHIHPERVEACDNYQAARYPVDTKVKSSCLIRQASIQYVPQLGMTEISECEAWTHFRNPAGLVLSCRRWKEDYENLDPIFDCAGSKATLPGGLAEVVDRASIFSAENAKDDNIFVHMKNGKLLVRGEGLTGKFEEQRDIKFDGDISFLIAPKLLVEITQRANDCVIGDGRLRIDAERFVYVSCLGAVPD